MKKYIQVLVVFILTATIVGMARNNHAWASPLSSGEARPDSEITITEDGEYTVGGVCNLNVKYKIPNLSNHAAVDVPAEKSREVTFSYPDNLYLSGCHITHFKENKVKNEMSSDEGDWEVCFGDRPDETLTIYYYSDELAAIGQAVWLPLPTIKKDTFVCAPAMYTGVYAPGGIFIPKTGGAERNLNMQDVTTRVGTVMVTTSTTVKITKSGRYGAGGICEMIVEYYVPNLSDELHVEENVEISANVPFPDNQGLLYLPGCHVFHYKTGALVDEVTSDEGKWEICFAAIPGKQTTIYFYYSDSDLERVTSVWSPLETKVDGGSACASLVNFTGVYTPVGKDN
jgi:hypothetical protein